YMLFLAALKDTRHNAIAKVAMHNREHVVLIRPSDDGLLLHTLFYQDELHRANRGQPLKMNYTAKELELAKSLVERLSASFGTEEFQDTYRRNVERLIEQKRKGQKVTPAKQPKRTEVIDLMEALKRSLKSTSETGIKAARKTRASARATRKHQAA